MRVSRIIWQRFKDSSIRARDLFRDVAHKELQTPLIKLRHEQRIPGSTTKNFPEHISTKPNRRFKAIQLVSNEEETKNIAKCLRSYLDELIVDFPGILIKGLPISSIADFNFFAKELAFKCLDVSSGRGYRSHLVDNIYVASDEPKEIIIEPHNEMAYSAVSPGKIMFCCVKPADEGGANPLVFNHDIMRDLDENVTDKIINKKVRYYANLRLANDGEATTKKTMDFTWQGTLRVNTEQEAEQVMASQHLNWKWRSNGDLAICTTLDALRAHPVSGELIWFNQVTNNHASYYQAYPKYSSPEYLDPWKVPYHCTYGDGEEFEEYVLDHVRTTIWSNAMSLKLEAGDILLMDNFLCQHSRTRFNGDRIYAVQLIE
ncbi:dapdiamide synthesis protein DdaC-like [Hydractinia symbiolongicarpus]|uniref:dapdiamide synthesis protein DdaC-like n=1 Tax=Hydractinia symbiolongicarpus TaxID=13093 RepID=UPI00254D84D1|nr:dapdiamide synthesis protein DdaC-like [Hydractinia symbiolongicarpus]